MPEDTNLAAAIVEAEAAPSAPAEAPDEAPPFLGTWRNVYLFVAGELALVVLALWILTRWAS